MNNRPKEKGGLNTAPNFEDPDGFYSALLAAHEHLTAEQSEAFNARLILILANHIGDQTALLEALSVANRSDVGDA